jgi:hypothetical protein
MDRRNFLERAAVGTSLFLPISSLFLAKDAKGASEPNQAPPLSAGDVALATIALNAGYLESEFFLRALTGKGLSTEDTSGLGAAGPVLVSKEDPLKFRDPSIKAIAEQITRDELAHVHALRSTFASFGLTPPARPTIDLKNTFLTLAEGAGIDRDFDPFDSERDFLVFAFFLEQITSSTFVGAIPLLQNNVIKSLAASLLGTETSHNGFVRLGLAQEKLIDKANQIAAFSQKLVNSAQTIIRPLFDGRLLLSPVGDDGLVSPLDGRQFLNCILLGINVTAGGFYPNGLNFA